MIPRYILSIFEIQFNAIIAMANLTYMRRPKFEALMLQLSIKAHSSIQIKAFPEYFCGGVIIMQYTYLS